MIVINCLRTCVCRWPRRKSASFIYIKNVQLMCAFKVHINESIFKKVLLKIEKIVKIFSILDKIFTKLVY